jgi:hypothetical protein
LERILKEAVVAYSRYYYSRIASAPADIQTEHLRNTSEECYRFVNLLGE